MEAPWTGVTKLMETSLLSPHGFTICGLWFTTSRPTSCFAKRTLFRAYGRTIAPSCQIFFCVGYCGKDLVSLNIVRLFRNILHLSDISKCDGTTLDKFTVLDYLNSLLGTCSHERNQRQQTLEYGKMVCIIFALGQQCFQPN